MRGLRVLCTGRGRNFTVQFRSKVSEKNILHAVACKSEGNYPPTNETLLSICVFISDLRLVSQVRINVTKGGETAPLCFNNAAASNSPATRSARRLTSVCKTIASPRGPRFLPFTSSELKLKFLFLAYNFSCRFGPRYL